MEGRNGKNGMERMEGKEGRKEGRKERDKIMEGGDRRKERKGWKE